MFVCKRDLHKKKETTGSNSYLAIKVIIVLAIQPSHTHTNALHKNVYGYTPIQKQQICQEFKTEFPQIETSSKQSPNFEF